jgi:hypothetical protein
VKLITPTYMMERLKVKIEKQTNKIWVADSAILCGSAPIGKGDTRGEAITDLYARLLVEIAYKTCYKDAILKALE